MEVQKRPAPVGEGYASTALVPAKRARTELVKGTQKGPQRTSNLQSPIMLLTGHESEIYTAKFSPDGQYLCSAGFDQQMLVWNVYGECENLAVIRAHHGAVMRLEFGRDSCTVYTCGTDRAACVWDLATGQRVKRFKGHSGIVNTLNGTRHGTELLATASDDATVKIWDLRYRKSVQSIACSYAVCAISWNDAANAIFTGGIDNTLKWFDLRMLREAESQNDVQGNALTLMHGHSDTITGMELSPDGNHIATNSMDNTVRIWDVRPYVNGERCVKLVTGHQHTFEKNLLGVAWSPDGGRVSAGSADRFVYVWDIEPLTPVAFGHMGAPARLLYKLPGHSGSVNETDFHPIEPLILSASSDKKIFIGELS